MTSMTLLPPLFRDTLYRLELASELLRPHRCADILEDAADVTAGVATDLCILTDMEPFAAALQAHHAYLRVRPTHRLLRATRLVPQAFSRLEATRDILARGRLHHDEHLLSFAALSIGKSAQGLAIPSQVMLTAFNDRTLFAEFNSGRRPQAYAG